MAGLTGVEALSESLIPFAEKLAKKWGVKAGPVPVGPGIRAVLSDAGLGLQFNDPALGKKPYYVDFVDLGWKQLFSKGLPKTHIFRKALGVHVEPWTLFDATAGFGGDAMLAAILGARVTAVERSPVIAEVLRDGLKRAAVEDEALRDRIERIRVLTGESAEVLSKLKSDEAPDVVFIDPMFDKPKKTAKSPKEMQLLQALLGDPPSEADEMRLFEAAYAAARNRVVVKRALKAKAVVASPGHSFKGQSVRYDVYYKS